MLDPVLDHISEMGDDLDCLAEKVARSVDPACEWCAPKSVLYADIASVSTKICFAIV
jgi:hypothetical protein